MVQPLTLCEHAEHASTTAMIHKGIEFTIRASLGREQWAVLIYYPSTENEVKNATVAQVGGTREKAEAVARGRIDYWLKNQRKVQRAHQS